MKTVYLINAMIPREIYDTGIKYLLPSNSDFRVNGNTVSGIYAWTDSKKFLEDFLEARDSSVYKVVPIKFDDKDEFKTFKFNNKDAMLMYKSFNSECELGKSNKIDILVTFNEYIQSTDYGSENMFEFGFSGINLTNYHIFKEKLIESLDILNYTVEYDKHNDDDSIRESNDYNMSFGITSLGHRIKFDVNNEVNVLLHLFRYFFSGVEKGD